jgi:hypothetical protein
MDAILEADARNAIKWSGSIQHNSKYPNSRPPISDSEEVFFIFAKRVEYCHKNKNGDTGKFTVKAEMDNPKPRKKDTSAVSLSCNLLDGIQLEY